MQVVKASYQFADPYGVVSSNKEGSYRSVLQIDFDNGMTSFVPLEQKELGRGNNRIFLGWEFEAVLLIVEKDRELKGFTTDPLVIKLYNQWLKDATLQNDKARVVYEKK